MQLIRLAPILGITAMLAACTPEQQPATGGAGTAVAGPPCLAEPTRWAGREPGRCLTYSSHGQARSRTLVVVMHGDLSSGAPATYHRQLAAEAARSLPEAAVVALVRPGYPDGEGRTSDGALNGRNDHYTAANMALVAEAIGVLRQRTGAERVIAVGHSGGAATAANILALHPGTLDAAALLACPCALRPWRAGRSAWSRSVDPLAGVPAVPTTARVIAYTGDLDTNTQPVLARQYVDGLAARGVSARFTAISADHNNIVTQVWRNGFGTALAELARP